MDEIEELVDPEVYAGLTPQERTEIEQILRDVIEEMLDLGRIEESTTPLEQ